MKFANFKHLQYGDATAGFPPAFLGKHMKDRLEQEERQCTFPKDQWIPLAVSSLCPQTFLQCVSVDSMRMLAVLWLVFIAHVSGFMIRVSVMFSDTCNMLVVFCVVWIGL